jgi:hypothetical protein
VSATNDAPSDPAAPPQRPSIPIAAPVPGARIEALDPENRETIVEALVELAERERQRIEEEAALPPPPPPPQRRWSVAIGLLVLAAVTWGFLLLRRPPGPVVKTLAPNASSRDYRRLLGAAALQIETYFVTHGRLPDSLPQAGAFPAGLRYYPDTGVSFVLELTTARGTSHLSVTDEATTYREFSPTELHPTPTAPGASQ